MSKNDGVCYENHKKSSDKGVVENGYDPAHQLTNGNRSCDSNSQSPEPVGSKIDESVNKSVKNEKSASINRTDVNLNIPHAKLNGSHVIHKINQNHDSNMNTDMASENTASTSSDSCESSQNSLTEISDSTAELSAAQANAVQDSNLGPERPVIHQTPVTMAIVTSPSSHMTTSPNMMSSENPMTFTSVTSVQGQGQIPVIQGNLVSQSPVPPQFTTQPLDPRRPNLYACPIHQQMNAAPPHPNASTSPLQTSTGTPPLSDNSAPGTNQQGTNGSAGAQHQHVVHVHIQRGETLTVQYEDQLQRVQGCAAVMKRQNPHMNNVHCIAHKLALCTSQAAEQIDTLKQHQQILTDLFYYFKGSAKRAAKLRDIQVLLDDPQLTIKEIHSIRWLSYFNALTTIYRTLDSLLTYLADSGVSDPKAHGLKKKIATDKFLSITYMMMDAMAPVTILSQFFQTENVDIALVKVKLELCVDDLKKVKNLQSPYMTSLVTDLPPDQSLFKGQHQISRTPGFNLQSLTSTFIDSLVENIESRFPQDDLMTAFSVLSMRPITYLQGSELDDYGNNEIQTLCQFYGQPQTMKWKEDGTEKECTSRTLIDPDQTINEWKLLKRVVLAEKYPRDSMWKLWQLITQFHKEFPNMSTLAQLALTSSVHTAGCERGFSIQNRILSTFRNRLAIDKQQKMMMVKIDGSCTLKAVGERDRHHAVFDFETAVLKWKKSKDRRIYELKKLK